MIHGWTALCSAQPGKNLESSTPNMRSNTKVHDFMLNTRLSAGSKGWLVVGGSAVAVDTILFHYNSFLNGFAQYVLEEIYVPAHIQVLKAQDFKSLCSVCVYVALFHPRSTALYAGPRTGWGYVPSERNRFFITLYIVLLLVFCLFFVVVVFFREIQHISQIRLFIYFFLHSNCIHTRPVIGWARDLRLEGCKYIFPKKQMSLRVK